MRIALAAFIMPLAHGKILGLTAAVAFTLAIHTQNSHFKKLSSPLAKWIKVCYNKKARQALKIGLVRRHAMNHVRTGR